jgi:long-chain acyl-CoA synthetase
MSFNLAFMLRETAQTTPDQICCHLGEESMTYAQLDELSGRVAASLRRSGLERGDTVALQLPNLPQFLIGYFGILKAGLVMLPMNPLLKTAEISHQLIDARARLLITYASCLEYAIPAAEQAAEKVGDIPIYAVGPAPTPTAPDGTMLSDVRPFDELASSAADQDQDQDAADRDIASTQADDTAVIIYTSGTTGKPKGAELTHFQLYMNCTTSGNDFGATEEDVTLAVLPLFHIYGLSGMLNVAVRFGAALVLVPRFDAELVLDAMERHRVSVFVGVPTMYHALLAAGPGDRDLSSFRLGSCGGAAMPAAVLFAFEERFGISILEGYGLTETASTATMNRVGERRPLSIGKPMWGVQARIVDPDGAELPPGPEQIGEILIRGHNVMKGYLGNPQATAEAVRDGWLHTGDLAYRDEDGFLFIVDRIKDLIIRGGYNVYPREVEEVLHTHPDVFDAAVIGRPDERLGQEIVAVVVPRPGVEPDPDELSPALIEYCRAQLADYKCPREVRFVTEIPRSATGKPLRRQLRTS